MRRDIGEQRQNKSMSKNSISQCHYVTCQQKHMCFYLLLNDLLSISKQLWKNEAVY